jgi:hypothetical protein
LKRELPNGLDDSYMQNFERIASNVQAMQAKGKTVTFHVYQQFLSLLVTMQGPLCELEAQRILKIEYQTHLDTLSELVRHMFPLRCVDEVKCYFWFHKSVVDFLTDPARSDN